MSDTKVAPNIWKTESGYRVFIRVPDPITGKSKLAPRRFKDDGRPEREQLADLALFRDTAKIEARKERLRDRHTRRVAATAAPTFAQDAAGYLALETVKAMPSYKTRLNEIAKWVDAFGGRVRASITVSDIDEQLQRWRNADYSAASVNKFRTALMALYTRLDGRGAANPVKDTRLYQEADLGPRGLPYELLTRVLDAVADGKWRARLEVLAWTGMEPKQLKRMTADHLSMPDQWYVTPQRDKGDRRRRTPRPVIRKPMESGAVSAFQRFIDSNAWGHFSTSALRRVFNPAQAQVQAALRVEYADPAFRLPHIRLKDLRHSFGTKLYEQTGGNVAVVGQMLDHAPGSPMPLRYAQGAVPTVLRTHMRAFSDRVRRPK